MNNLKTKEVWFITGSQDLYGPATLSQVSDDSKVISASLNKSKVISQKIVFKPVLTTPHSIAKLCTEANSDPKCIGLIAWMHTFSPAKMWIQGLSVLNKPFLHFHTQLNRDIPWDTIDMNFMNLNQSAHGDREFGFINSRMRLNRKVVVGHYLDREAIDKIAIWIRAATAHNDAQGMRVARFGDNMREVAVTEGNKVSAQIMMGYSVYGYGIGDLVKEINRVSDKDIKKLLAEYASEYSLSAAVAKSGTLKEAARIELGMEYFLRSGGFKAFTTTFEDLHGMKQLPGIAVQRLMSRGFGFGAEGDWKTAAVVRSMKVMAEGLKGGTSFMEDYTYHMDPENMSVLGAHMLEICPSIAMGKPSVQVHQLSIGGKDDPARLVFKTAPSAAINVSVVDLGNRFRMIVNDVEVIKCPEMPKLPVASVLWKPMPDLRTGASAWILAGGAHHTGFSTAINSEYLEDFAGMTGIEYIHIGRNFNLSEFRNKLRWNELYYHLGGGFS